MSQRVSQHCDFDNQCPACGEPASSPGNCSACGGIGTYDEDDDGEEDEDEKPKSVGSPFKG